MSDDQVKRYQLDYHHTQTYAEMVEDCDGDWVKYNDYKAASDRIEELEGKLAEATEALEGVRSFTRDLGLYADQGHTLAPALRKACDTIAELKGEQ